MIPVKQNLVSSSKHSLKCPYAMSAEYITVHNTANDASAENEIKYMIGNNTSTSYHFAIDDKEVVQGILLNRNAWHAGDGGGNGNRKSIGIEVCYSKSGGDRYIKAEALSIKFVAQLLKERGWGVDKVKKHQDWSGKYCPHRILDGIGWKAYIDAVKKELDSLNAPAKVNSPTVSSEVKSDIKVTSTKIKVDGKVSEVDRILVEGRNYIQLRELERFGFKVDYDSANNLPILESPDRYPITETDVDVNGKIVKMKRILREDTNYVQLKGFSEAGFKVSYNSEKRIPEITT